MLYIACEYRYTHMCVSIPSKLSVPELVRYLKGTSAFMILDRHHETKNKWNRQFWSKDCYVTTIGNINEDKIRKDFTEQEDESKKEDTLV